MIRKANINDAVAIQHLIQIHAEKGQMLFRTLEDITRNIRDFFVFEKKKDIQGVCALNNAWEKTQMKDEGFKSDRDFGSLVEVRSLVVHPGHLREGIGTALVSRCIQEAMAMEKEEIFVLTYAVSMFKKLGFEVIDKSALPHKIWTDCRGCAKSDHCDETAMIRSLRVKPRRKTKSSPRGRKRDRVHTASRSA